MFVGVVVQAAGNGFRCRCRCRRRRRRRSRIGGRRGAGGTRVRSELLRIADQLAVKDGTVHEYGEVAGNLLYLSDFANLAIGSLDSSAHLERGDVGSGRGDGNTGRLAPRTIVPILIGELVDQCGVSNTARRFSYRLRRLGLWRRSYRSGRGNSADGFRSADLVAIKLAAFNIDA